MFLLVLKLIIGGGGGGSVNPGAESYSVMHSALLVTHLSTVFDNCGKLKMLLLSTEITPADFGFCQFLLLYCNEKYMENIEDVVLNVLLMIIEIMMCF